MSNGIQGFEFLGPKNKDVDTTTTESGTQITSIDFDPTAKAALDKALSDTSYSKESAIADAKAAADAMAKSVLEAGAPGVAGAAKAGGGYDSTTQTMLQNDLATRASSAGSQVILDTISKYNAAQAAAIAARSGAVRDTSGKTTETESAADKAEKERSAGALWDSLHPGAVAGGRYKEGGQTTTGMNTVICTQMRLDNHISQEVYDADSRYVRNYINYNVAKGYRFWAVPFVTLMRKNTVAYAIGKFFAVRWSKHCAATYLPAESKSILIYALVFIGVPICYIIGSVVADTEFKHLWETSPYRTE